MDKFLDEVCHHVSSRYDHAAIKKELSHHIEDMKEIYGEEFSLEQMGNPASIGDEFNDIYNPIEAWFFRITKAIVIILVVLLSTIGSLKGIDLLKVRNQVILYSDGVNMEGLYKSNYVVVEGNRYEWDHIKVEENILFIHVNVDETVFSRSVDPQFSNLIINDLPFSIDETIQIRDYTGIAIQVDIKIDSIESLLIEINGKRLYAQLKEIDTDDKKN